MMRLSALALLLACGAMLSVAQTGTGTVRGTVYDPGRSAILRVKLVLTHVATNVSQTGLSSEIGFYLFAGLQPGDYRLVAEKGGFKKWAGKLELQAGQVAVVESMLEVGAVEMTLDGMSLVDRGHGAGAASSRRPKRGLHQPVSRGDARGVRAVESEVRVSPG